MDKKKAHGRKTPWIDAKHPVFGKEMYFNILTMERVIGKKVNSFVFQTELAGGPKEPLRLLSNGFLYTLLKHVSMRQRTDPLIRSTALTLAMLSDGDWPLQGPGPMIKGGDGCVDLSKQFFAVGFVGAQCVAWALLSSIRKGGSAGPNVETDTPSFECWVWKKTPSSEHIEAKVTDKTPVPIGCVTGDLDRIKAKLAAHGLVVTPNSKLRMLDLSYNNLSVKTVSDVFRLKLLCVTLQQSPTCVALNLRCNPLGPIGGVVLGGLLNKNQHLHTLNLNDADLGDDGVEGLMEGLKNNTALWHLDLDCNGITDVGATLLAITLCHCRLHVLRLCHNSIGPAGLSAIASALQINSTLSHLWLDGNDITGATRSAKLLRNVSGLRELFFPDASANLECVSLAKTLIGDAGFRAIAPLLVVNKVLGSLDLRSCMLSKDSSPWLAKVMRHNKSMHTVDVRLNDGIDSEDGVDQCPRVVCC